MSPNHEGRVTFDINEEQFLVCTCGWEHPLPWAGVDEINAAWGNHIGSSDDPPDSNPQGQT